MSGSRPQEREHREIAFRIGGSEHVEIISEIVTVSVGIPADVTVRLVINAVAFTVADPFFKAITGAGFSFPCAGINRCSITSDSKIIEVNQPPFHPSFSAFLASPLEDGADLKCCSYLRATDAG